LVLVVAGAGLSLPHRLWRQAGCSRYFVAADILYAEDEVTGYGGAPQGDAGGPPAVSREMAQQLAAACLRRHPGATLALAVTAAVTSARLVRRGHNKAELALLRSDSDTHLVESRGEDDLLATLSRDVCERVVGDAGLQLLLVAFQQRVKVQASHPT